MSAYVPTGPVLAAFVGGLAVFVLVVGFVVARLRPPALARAAAWAVVLAV